MIGVYYSQQTFWPKSVLNEQSLQLKLQSAGVWQTSNRPLPLHVLVVQKLPF